MVFSKKTIFFLRLQRGSNFFEGGGVNFFQGGGPNVNFYKNPYNL